MSDPFTAYETDMQRLLDKLGPAHPRYAEAATYQQRLSENIALTRQYGDTETRRAERSAVIAQINAFVREISDPGHWDTGLKYYTAHLLRLHGEIKMLSSPRPTRLDDIFTDVYLLDQPSAYRRFAIQQLREDPERLKRVQRLNGLDLVQQPGHTRLFILGKPGAGKTTFLKYLTLQAIRRKIVALPIFVTLKEWADSGLELMAFIEQQFAHYGFPNAQVFIQETLRSGKALLLFDGLDEVPQEGDQHARTIQALKQVSDQYLDSRMVVSCRVAATDYSFTRFTYVEVADFNDAQVRTFVTKWFVNEAQPDDERKQAEQTRDMFFQEYRKEEHRGLQELGRLPLLLALLCLAFEQTRRFPHNRSEIYKSAIEALLEKWDSSRNIQRDAVYRHLTPERKRQVLSQVAVETFSNGDYFIAQEALERMLTRAVSTLPVADRDPAHAVDGAAILTAIAAQHGILVERAHQIYSFAHLSFQEYFTARYIADHASEGLLRQLCHFHLTDSRWREVFLLTASMLQDATSFIIAFRQALDEQIAGDADIVALLHWAARKAAQTAAGYDQVAVRSLYLSLPLARARARAHASASARELARARAHTSTSARASASTRASTRASASVRELASQIARSRTSEIALTNASAIAIAIAIAIDLNLASAHILVLDLASDPMPFLVETVSQGTAPAGRIRPLAALHQYITDVYALIPTRDSTSAFAQAIAALPLPTVAAPQGLWRSFTNALQAVLIEHRDIGHMWTLTQDQVERIEKYLKATHFLIECLKLAAVADRSALEATLLLPPGEWSLPPRDDGQVPGPKTWWKAE